MSKRFFHLSLGILCLAIAYNLGARSARADWEPGVGGIIAGGSGRVCFSQAGEAYVLEPGASLYWVPVPSMDIPVDPSAVKFMNDYDNASGMVLVTSSDNVWHWSTWGETWQLAPPFPGSGTPVEKDSWGGVKKRWRG